MARFDYTVELRGQEAVIEILTAVSKEAQFSQRTALRSAATKARSMIRKSAAARLGLPMKVFRKRVDYFWRTVPGQKNLSSIRLWTGLEKGVKASEHKKARSQLKAKYPKGFEPVLPSGHKGWFYQVNPSRPFGVGARLKRNWKARGKLPILEYKLELPTDIRQDMIDAAHTVMRTVYPTVLRREYNRRIRRRGASLKFTR